MMEIILKGEPNLPMTTVLVADEDATIRQVVGMVLEDEGYTFLESATAATTLHLLATVTTPMVVLLTLSLAPSTTILVQTIANSPALHRRHRFLLVTSRILRESDPHEAAVMQSLRSFTHGTLRKPFEIESLLTCIQEAETTFS